MMRSAALGAAKDTNSTLLSFRRSLRRMLVPLAVGAMAALAATSVARASGVNCTKPLNLDQSFQDLSDCNLSGLTVSGNTALGFSNLNGANMSSTTPAERAPR